ncbi:MAG: hypothetical protein GY790_03925 [Bacteroidetes bacterium]|nr:hypothetical protein [Bacteroidota bacterium]
MSNMKTILITGVLLLSFISIDSKAQVNIYRSGGGEIILSGADVQFNNEEVSTNMRFTLFFHTQQLLNIDLTSKFGFYTGAAIRNVGLITEDLYQNVGFGGIDNTHPDWNKNTKVKRRSYSLGFPIAFKIGQLNKKYFLYAGGEYEWMFLYKQKLFLDDNKTKFKEWGSKRVNPWVPSLFAGIQFPGGFNLKLKYYMQDFLNTDFQGVDFGEDVDYSQFQSSGIWYISVAVMLNKKQLKRMMEAQKFDKTAYR